MDRYWRGPNSLILGRGVPGELHGSPRRMQYNQAEPSWGLEGQQLHKRVQVGYYRRRSNKLD